MMNLMKKSSMFGGERDACIPRRNTEPLHLERRRDSKGSKRVEGYENADAEHRRIRGKGSRGRDEGLRTGCIPRSFRYSSLSFTF